MQVGRSLAGIRHRNPPPSASESSAWCQQVIFLLAPPDSGCFPLCSLRLWEEIQCVHYLVQHTDIDTQGYFLIKIALGIICIMTHLKLSKCEFKQKGCHLDNIFISGYTRVSKWQLVVRLLMIISSKWLFCFNLVILKHLTRTMIITP